MSGYFSARVADRLFFTRHPTRDFLARCRVDGDVPLPHWITPFAKDDGGNLREINLVIVKRITGGFIRLLFSEQRAPSLNSDAQIIVFLCHRNIDPDTMKRLM
jgi:hypothetical protein